MDTTVIVALRFDERNRQISRNRCETPAGGLKMPELIRAPALSPELTADLVTFAGIVESAAQQEAAAHRSATPALDAAIGMRAAWQTLMSPENESMPTLRERAATYLGAVGLTDQAENRRGPTREMLELLAPDILGQLYTRLPQDRPKPQVIADAERDKSWFFRRLALLAGGKDILRGVQWVLSPDT